MRFIIQGCEPALGGGLIVNHRETVEGSIIEMQEAVGFYGHLPFKHGSPNEDGFNPYGSGPEPIGRRK